MRNYSLNYLGGFPRDALRIVQCMLEKWPSIRLFSVDYLSDATGMDGRTLSGPLSAFSKRDGEPLVIKAGTTNKTVDDGKYRRPKQLWAINPNLSKSDLQDIRIKIDQLVGLGGMAGIGVIKSGWSETNIELCLSDSQFSNEQPSTRG